MPASPVPCPAALQEVLSALVCGHHSPWGRCVRLLLLPDPGGEQLLAPPGTLRGGSFPWPFAVLANEKISTRIFRGNPRGSRSLIQQARSTAPFLVGSLGHSHLRRSSRGLWLRADVALSWLELR